MNRVVLSGLVVLHAACLAKLGVKTADSDAAVTDLSVVGSVDGSAEMQDRSSRDRMIPPGQCSAKPVSGFRPSRSYNC